MSQDSNSPDVKPLVVIAAGGTGGHMFPAQAFAEEMRVRGWTIALVTDERGKKYAANFPADWRLEVEAATFGSKLPHKLVASALKLRKGTAEARKNFEKTKPSLIAGFGGYPSYPSLSAARHMDIPILIHEQNSVLGRVNRLFAGQAKFVACGFERLDKLPPAAAGRKRVVGNPVRSAIKAVRDKPYPELSDTGPLTILVTGGSQGA
ncbi:MAG: glycosyltransferase, partial [Rhodanobacter sp.]